MVFAHIDERTASPTWNIILVGIVSAIGALILNYERSAELINFGAFLAFMGVNLSVIRHSITGKFREAGHGWFTGVVLPALGFLFCLSIWVNLSRPAQIVGALWFAGGVLIHIVQSRRNGADFHFDFDS